MLLRRAATLLALLLSVTLLSLNDASAKMARSVTVTAGGTHPCPTTPYADAVLGDHPVSYWPLGDSGGTGSDLKVEDCMGNYPLQLDDATNPNNVSSFGPEPNPTTTNPPIIEETQPGPMAGDSSMEFCPGNTFCQARVLGYPIRPPPGSSVGTVAPSSGSWSIGLWFKPRDAAMCGTDLNPTQSPGNYGITGSPVCRLWSSWSSGSEVDVDGSGRVIAGFYYANQQPNIVSCGPGSNPGTVSITSQDGFSDESWHFLVLVRDVQQEQFTLYVDGKVEAQESTPDATSGPSPTDPCYSGTIPPAVGFANYADMVNPYSGYRDGSSPFYGWLSEVAFYQSALSPAQVAAQQAAAPPAPWAINPTGSNYPGEFLDSVSCPTATFCVAVGATGSPDSTGSPLIETDINGTWSVTPLPSGLPAGSSALADVSCPSPTFCMAVGTSIDNNQTHTFALTMDRGVWSVASTPIDPTNFSELEGVSCTNAAPIFCVTVGDSAPGQIPPADTSTPLVEVDDGGSWTTDTFSYSNPGYWPALGKISCTTNVRGSATVFCMVIGYGDNQNGSGQSQTLAESLTFSGNSTPTATPVPSKNVGGNATSSNALYGVSCTGQSFCMAVGASEKLATRQTKTIAEQYLGTVRGFRPTRTVNPSSIRRPGVKTNYFYSVSCVAPSNNCVAAGYYTSRTSIQDTLVETYPGTGHWSISNTPNATGASRNELGGISCIDIDSCTTVGWYFNGLEYSTLVLAE